MTKSTPQRTKLMKTVNSLAIDGKLHTIKDINEVFNIDVFDTEAPSVYPATLLGLAAKEADVFLVNALLENGADPNLVMHKDTDNLTLHFNKQFMEAHTYLTDQVSNDNYPDRSTTIIIA